MVNNDLTDLSSRSLPRWSDEQLQNQSVLSVILGLGSNHQADSHLSCVRKNLAQLGQLELSNAFRNPDITATLDYPKPDYTNQCVHLILDSSMAFNKLKRYFKSLEGDCGRQRLLEDQSTIKIVTMDIDVLLVKLELTDTNIDSLSKNITNEWVAIAERYPFKNHEIIGLEELKITQNIDFWI